MIEEKKRIEYIDLAKGVCIVLVVFMHIIPEWGKGSFLVILRMPLYYFLSGLFFKTYDGFKNFGRKKIDNLLLPFVAWYFISYAIYYVRVLLIGHPAEHVFHISDLFLQPDFYNGSIWFLLSLFWCNILYYLIESSFKTEWLKCGAIIIIASIGWWLSYQELHNFLYIGTSLVCLPFFYIGRLSVKSGIVNNEKSIKSDLILLSICTLIVGAIYLFPIESPQMYFYLNRIESGIPPVLYLGAFCLILILLTLCKYIGRVPYISFLGRFSIIVLLTHGLVNNVIRRSVAKAFQIDVENLTSNVIMFVVTISMMALIIPFCRKYLPYITAQKSALEFLRNRLDKSEKSVAESA